jgi:hypothetical protein
MLWNKGYSRFLDQDKLLRRLKRTFGLKRKFLLILSDTPYQTIDPKGFVRLYKSEPGVVVSDEQFSIWLRQPTAKQLTGTHKQSDTHQQPR